MKLKLSEIHPNPNNPRLIKDDKFKKLVQSLKDFPVWVKQTMVMGRQDYQWQHEPILYGWKPGAAHNWFTDRKQTTILEFDRPQSSEEHPTMKPISILAYLIKNSSKPNELVFDNFLGSGSTLIACEQTDRTCYGMELDEKYLDVIRKRYWKFVNNNDETGWEDNTPLITG
jgi:DNA modification methylase